MLALKVALWSVGFGVLAAAAGVIAHGLWLRMEWLRRPVDGRGPLPRLQWKRAGRLAAWGVVILLGGRAVVLVPSGMAGVRISQLSGTRPGTLYPGVHLVRPLIDDVALYDTRDQFLTAGPTPSGKGELLKVQTKEGLSLGLAVTVRYRLDPQRLDHIHADLPQPVETEIVAPVVTSAFRDILPQYMVRETFASKRDEVRLKATQAITQRLKQDGIEVREVMLRDVALPPEYARGLEGLLLKQQEDERMVFELQIKEKQVREAELQADADKVRQVKAADAQAQVRVLQAKGEADAMQYTLPLKEKQIQQTRLEAEARKESTLKNAEAAAQAKVIDSKADLERSRLMADAEANRIRVTSAADAERMRQEAIVIKDNPLMIQKIVAERLSDKMQIMMVPMDGKNFFANDVFRAASMLNGMAPAPEPEPQPQKRNESQTKVARRR
jgi:regulator of protease activity HflC (stomatin/prohibitin superfamily)